MKRHCFVYAIFAVNHKRAVGTHDYLWEYSKFTALSSRCIQHWHSRVTQVGEYISLQNIHSWYAFKRTTFSVVNIILYLMFLHLYRMSDHIGCDWSARHATETKGRSVIYKTNSELKVFFWYFWTIIWNMVGKKLSNKFKWYTIYNKAYEWKWTDAGSSEMTKLLCVFVTDLQWLTAQSTESLNRELNWSDWTWTDASYWFSLWEQVHICF